MMVPGRARGARSQSGAVRTTGRGGVELGGASVRGAEDLNGASGDRAEELGSTGKGL